MNWFEGEITAAIQKAITEKKVFLVFVTDDNEDSRKMKELWLDTEIAAVCSDEQCVSITVVADSVSGQQFATIYPILCVPSTYLINNDGMPTDIIPGQLQQGELLKRLNDGIQKTLSSNLEKTLSQINTDDNPQSTVSNTTQGSSLPSNDAQQKESDESSKLAKERAEVLLDKSRSLQAKKLKEKVKDDERKRRETGVELAKARKDMAERQAKKLADEIAKQKLEEKLAREKIRAQILQDKAEKAARYEADKQWRQGEKDKKKADQLVAQSKPKVESNTCRIQLKLPDGSSSTKQFDADAKFIVILNYAQECIKDPSLSNIRLTTIFPKHEFTTDDYIKSLRELKLTPAASIIVSRGRSTSTTNVSTSSLNPLSLIMLVLAPIFAIFTWIASLFSGGGGEDGGGRLNEGGGTDESNTNSHDRGTNSSVRRRTTGGRSNIRQLHDNQEDDDENNTWNGNSTQQM